METQDIPETKFPRGFDIQNSLHVLGRYFLCEDENMSSSRWAGPFVEMNDIRLSSITKWRNGRQQYNVAADIWCRKWRSGGSMAIAHWNCEQCIQVMLLKQSTVDAVHQSHMSKHVYIQFQLPFLKMENGKFYRCVSFPTGNNSL